jgi:hypothetical protein
MSACVWFYYKEICVCIYLCIYQWKNPHLIREIILKFFRPTSEDLITITITIAILLVLPFTFNIAFYFILLHYLSSLVKASNIVTKFVVPGLFFRFYVLLYPHLNENWDVLRSHFHKNCYIYVHNTHTHTHTYIYIYIGCW